MLQPDASNSFVVSSISCLVDISASLARINGEILCCRVAAPCSIFSLQYLEDRVNTGPVSPSCLNPQISYLLSNYSTSSAYSSMIVATWTRPMALSDQLVELGYVGISTGGCILQRESRHRPC